MTIQISRESKNKVIVDTGVSRDLVNPNSLRAIETCAKRLVISTEELQAACYDFLETEGEESAPKTRFSLKIWSKTQGTSAQDLIGDPSEVFEKVLASSHEYSSWNDISKLAALDIDIPSGGSRFTELQLTRWLYQIVPSPAYLWVTTNGGARGIFLEGDGLTADENAALFDLLLTDYTPRKQTELLSRTRTPPKTSRVIHGFGSSPDLRSRVLCKSWNGSYSEADRDSWLEEHGMEIDQRYDHAKYCIICPGVESPRDPVVTTESGIICYRDGFRSWAQILHANPTDEEPILPLAVQAAKSLAHWTHAKYLLQAQYPDRKPNLLRAGYRALIKLIHAHEKKLDKILARIFSRDFDFFRSSDGMWVDDTTQRTRKNVSRETLRQLPAGNSVAKQDKLAEPIPVEGYIGITPIIGLESPSMKRPDLPLAEVDTVYIPARVRNLHAPTWDEKDAFGYLSQLPNWSPSISGALRCILVGALRAQYSPPMPSMILITGPTGSGKGAIASLAAGILGRNAAKLDIAGGQVELSMSIGEALDDGEAILVLDEVGKISRFWRESSPLLQLASELRWRKLHQGHVVSRMKAALVLLGSTLPTSMPSMAEFQRRMPVARLNHSVGDLAAACRDLFDCGRFEDIRLVPNEANLGVTNAIFHWAKDFAAKRATTPWVEIAYELGLEPLSSVDTERDAEIDLLRTLYLFWIDQKSDHFFPVKHPRYGRRPWLDASKAKISGCDPPTEVGKLVESWLHGEDFKQVKGAWETMDIGETLDLESPMIMRISSRREMIAIQFVPPTHRNKDRIDPSDRSIYPDPRL